MKKITFCTAVVLIFACCNHGVWNTTGVYNTYRPKHPKFKILKQPFIKNGLIDTNHLYIDIAKTNYGGDDLVGFYGFFGNGRMLVTGGKKNDILNIVNYTNSLVNATWIGYYTTKGDKIKLEYFVPSEGGEYETMHGIIKKDTIIFMETIRGGASLFSKEVRSDTLIKSPYFLR